MSCREYERCAEAVPEAFGLSSSTISRHFKRTSVKKLRERSSRRLEEYDFVALVLDGKTLVEGTMIVTLGVTITGDKVVLGFVQTSKGNGRVCTSLLPELVERGLRFTEGLFVLIDGSDGLYYQAVNKVLIEPPLRSAVTGTSAKRC